MRFEIDIEAYLPLTIGGALLHEDVEALVNCTCSAGRLFIQQIRLTDLDGKFLVLNEKSKGDAAVLWNALTASAYAEVSIHEQFWEAYECDAKLAA
ncbi:hypothetical protein [Polycladidibacter hongkongensis]|uniref:hypothetical protein n=1 Tax=Polycladidibacter hongkongensis TaxID=1647556 RepID=UPI0008321FAD|nr:hypothetical protein [Pseudovibrio hongkongensis]